MKNKTSLISFFWLVIGSMLIFVFQSHTKSIPPNPIKSFLKKMHLIEGAEVEPGKTAFQTITEKDQSLLLGNIPLAFFPLLKREIDPFYISVTEVTNAEWMEFYEAMVEEVGYEKAMESYHPDTMVWVTDNKLDYTLPLAKKYHNYFIYYNHPVVNISWVQAQAYCQWKTQQLKALAKEEGKTIDLIFRLPTQYEWEHAALGPKRLRESSDAALYPWEGLAYKKNGRYLANFGRIVDPNGVYVESGVGDDGLFTTTVGKYPPNKNGLYDMAGNVAEWVADTAKIFDTFSRTMIYKESDLEEVIKEYDKRIALGIEDVYGLEYFKNIVEHDKAILSRGDMRTIKGGSWNDGLAYLQVGTMEAMDKDRKSSRVGFRIAMSYNKKHEKYFPKKHWQSSKK